MLTISVDRTSVQPFGGFRGIMGGRVPPPFFANHVFNMYKNSKLTICFQLLGSYAPSPPPISCVPPFCNSGSTPGSTPGSSNQEVAGLSPVSLFTPEPKMFGVYRFVRCANWTRFDMNSLGWFQSSRSHKVTSNGVAGRKKQWKRIVGDVVDSSDEEGPPSVQTHKSRKRYSLDDDSEELVVGVLSDPG